MDENDDLMYKLLEAKRDGQKIFYMSKVKGISDLTLIEVNHDWDLRGNVYKVQRRREFIIHINKNGSANIKQTDNTWTRSDFGKVESGEYILMREVYPEEMK